ncbi:hypothetical protein [Jatrophihabitans endophyticus]|uniref:hypothetical protein n=1 Tax=Jatrophihabitans endophyticus TaxID=1206085 RepID=UPI0019E5BA6F|nr:hypothetical protein [Jatrophihabitans endophyticus]MBE7188505.1 hypothetical protein [Jatrophihabitans endophyticus]
MAESSGYVTNDSWVRTAGRPDAIDEVADQFERRAEPAWPLTEDDGGTRWPQHSRGWRSIARLHPQPTRAAS